MFQRFRAEYAPLRDDVRAGATWQHERLASVEGYLDFAAEFAGTTFGGGLYRVHDDTSGAQALSLIADAFPEYATRACPFGYDWLGRQFAVDSGREIAGQPQVLLLEPGTGEVLRTRSGTSRSMAKPSRRPRITRSGRSIASPSSGPTPFLSGSECWAPTGDRGWSAAGSVPVWGARRSRTTFPSRTSTPTTSVKPTCSSTTRVRWGAPRMRDEATDRPCRALPRRRSARPTTLRRFSSRTSTSRPREETAPSSRRTTSAKFRD